MAHVGFRVIGLIVIPLIVYMFSFWLHFLILENSGPGDAQMSSLFQANLRGTEVGKDSPLEVAYGSRATLKNMGYGGGLLHSHVQTYPEGSTQQQITCYHHKDANNDWFFYPNRHQPEFDAEAPIKYVGNGDVIRFNGQENLGWLAGGVYRYDGTTDGQAFDCTYQSKHDHGRFQMTRPQVK